MNRPRRAAGSSGSEATSASRRAAGIVHRRQIGLGEVPVVVRFLLAAHADRARAGLIPEPRLLHDPAARLDQRDLPFDLVLERLPHVAEGVQVLHLGLRSKARLSRPGAPTRWRRSGGCPLPCCRRSRRARRAMCAQVLEEGRRFRRPIACRARVTISMSGTPARLKSRYVRSPQSANPSCSDLPASSSRCTRVIPMSRRRAARGDGHAPMARERLIVLRDLIALRQVGIEVILPREDRVLVDAAAERQRRARAQFDGAPVQHRQRARQAEAHRADVRIRRRAEAGRTAAEDLRVGEELCVDLEPDDRFERQ